MTIYRRHQLWWRNAAWLAHKGHSEHDCTRLHTLPTHKDTSSGNIELFNYSRKEYSSKFHSSLPIETYRVEGVAGHVWRSFMLISSCQLWRDPEPRRRSHPSSIAWDSTCRNEKSDGIICWEWADSSVYEMHILERQSQVYSAHVMALAAPLYLCEPAIFRASNFKV